MKRLFSLIGWITSEGDRQTNLNKVGMARGYDNIRY